MLHSAKDGELLRESKNPFKKHGISLQQATQRLVLDAKHKQATLVVKLWQSDQSPTVHSILQSQGSRGIVVGRGNYLSKLACMVRDCFDSKNGRSVTEAGDKSNLCFQRRRMEKNGRLNTSKAHLYTGKLVNALRGAHWIRTSKLPKFGAKALGQQSLPSFTSEELTAFEYKGATQEELRACYAAWRRLLKSVGVDVEESLIESTLYKAYGGTLSKKPHEHYIYDAPKIKMVLEKAAREEPWLGLLWRN